MKQFGIDISTFQNGINLDKAKDEGVSFAIIRGAFTGYGSAKGKAKDDRFEELYRNAKKSGLNVGAYYFSRATSYEEGKKEAEFLYNNCLKGKTFEYPIYMDVEDTVYQNKVSKNAINDAIRGFCEYIESVGGYVGVYCNLDWANNKMDYGKLSKKYDYWLAYWGNEMPSRNTYGNYGMWQYGGETNLIRGNTIAGKVVDQNYSYKDYPSIMKYNKLKDKTVSKEDVINLLTSLGFDYLDFTSNDFEKIMNNYDEETIKENAEYIKSLNISLDIFADNVELMYDKQMKEKIEKLTSIGKMPQDIYLNPSVLTKYDLNGLNNAIDVLKQSGLDAKNVPLIAY